MNEIQPYLDDIEKVLLQFGFAFKLIVSREKTTPTITYFKEYDTKLGKFSVYILKDSLTLLHPPVVVVHRCPQALEKSRLPHLLSDNTLCIFDKQTHLLDPLDYKAFYAAIAQKIDSIITLWESASVLEEFQNEFAIYWGFSLPCYLVSAIHSPQLKLYKYNHIDLENNIIDEYVISDGGASANQWKEKRNAVSNVDFISNVVTITFSKPMQVDYDRARPPKSMGELISWLRWSDESVFTAFLQQLSNNSNSSKYTFLFCFQENVVGVHFRLSHSARTVVKPRATIKKSGRKKQQHKVDVLSRVGSTSCFELFTPEIATQSFICNRNNKDTEQILTNKKVALIGCGTVGSHTAMGLVQAGAGSGTGNLVIYDFDTLSTGNLGRHVLGTVYLRENKAVAMKNHILKQGMSANISTEKIFHLNNVDDDWDYIIDTTGERPFSLLLAKKFRCSKQKKSLDGILIHGWVAGFGYAARALRDTGDGACYACQYVYKQGSLPQPRYPVFPNNKEPKLPFKRSCWANHLPFGTEVSMCSASMIIQLLDKSRTKENYLQRSFSNECISLKDVTLSKRNSCPSCSH
ncbi:ThiF family adenylyltransferase [Vibrio parahaemolyticus]|uniref:ThiF family adenylyltransferase n=1 Tax=Vibrio parahaemolyticus TaxID=670 RepID=UPI0003F5CAB1|nr:ThiF family adenylyltransferase [Vibrio parahaemolyticus]HCG6076203.1 ThiF family adenylyltransferase [Vibrio parahaemolyticus]HCG6091893.1 ThiF family adenylyltransferase [Vibrio parahaemolyticus]HCH1895849.1 ThiF family adenylyltransferase [Vibrio parahaemolyticus]HCH2964711.1 ThiF family adenylyltransferase [Vibrio parahaemolyticus]HCM0857109.1 ThiF family adenylyltransferase [Vibrio parahaemolyticus]